MAKAKAKAKPEPELAAYIPRRDPKQTLRKMISVSPNSYDRISNMAAEMKTTRTAIVAALLDFYED